jgi:hypothetical protein
MGKHHRLKEAALACVIALSLAQQTGSAFAYTTEPAAPPSAGAQQQPSQPQAGQPAAPQLSDPLAMPSKPLGTELTIPGIGSVGTIPKLDFGLELLYGPKNPTDNLGGLQLDQHAPDGEMQIKGTFTHKF